MNSKPQIRKIICKTYIWWRTVTKTYKTSPLRYLPRTNKNIFAKDLYKNVYGSLSPYDLTLATVLVAFNGSMDKQTLIYSFNRILLTNKIINTFTNMNESQKHSSECMKPYTNRNILHYSIYRTLTNRKRMHGVQFRPLFDTENVGWWDLDRNFGYPGVYTCHYLVQVYT